jgi:hypothetical protein
LGSDNQSAFSLPFDATIESVYATICTGSDITFPGGLFVYPFVQLYAAKPISNTFTSLPNTAVIPQVGLSGTVLANTTRAASKTQIGLSVTTGTRILICGQIQIRGTGNLAHNYSFNFTGGIALRPT